MIDDYYGHVIATVEGTVEAQNVVSFLSLQRGPVPMPEDDKGMGAEEWGQRNGDKGMGTKEWGQRNGDKGMGTGEAELANSSPILPRSNEDFTILNLVSIRVGLNVLKAVHDANHQRPLSKGL